MLKAPISNPGWSTVESPGEMADEILNALIRESYRINKPSMPFMLNHSVGSKPDGTEVDIPIIYADYYFIEALLRRKNGMSN